MKCHRVQHYVRKKMCPHPVSSILAAVPEARVVAQFATTKEERKAHFTALKRTT